MTVKEAIKEIIKSEGLDIFNDHKKFMAMLSDFDIADKKELNKFSKSVDKKILKICIDKNLDDDKYKINTIRMKLEDDGFAKETIDFIIEQFAFALGWNYSDSKSESKKEQQKQQTKKNNRQNIFVICIILFVVVLVGFIINLNNKSNPFKNANVGDYVEMGTYPQTADGEVQPIEWQVLSKDYNNNKILVISRYGLTSKRFDPNSENWNDSEIRSWLNGDFYNKAFNKEEKKNIKSFDSDNVFLLSTDEVEKYFDNAEARKCKATKYAVKSGAYLYDGYTLWGLRSCDPNNGALVYYIDSDGDLDHHYIFFNHIAVRPALWINI